MTAIERACSLVAAALDLGPEEVLADGTIGAVRGWDSLGHVKVLIAVEGALGRSLKAQETATIRSVGDIATLLGEPPAP